VLQPLPTLSVGLAEFPACGEGVHDVFGAADAALYTAKEQGRNCVVAAAVR
jgi:PleD family two-component response regulator